MTRAVSPSVAMTMLVALGCVPSGSSTSPEPEPVAEDPVVAASSTAPSEPAPSPAAPSEPVPGESPIDALGRQVPELQGCYEAALRLQPGLTGRLDYTLRIDRTGVVTGVTLDQDTLRSLQVAACARAKMLQWTFPSMAEPLTVSFPVVFAPSPR
jgi:hypothetical protein